MKAARALLWLTFFFQNHVVFDRTRAFDQQVHLAFS